MHLSLTSTNQSGCKTANSLDAKNTWCSGGFWRSQNLIIVRSPVGDWCQVYRLPGLGMQLKSNPGLHGALEITSGPQGLLTALLWEMGDVIPGLGRFWKATCHPSFPFHTLRHLGCSTSPRGIGETHLRKYKQAKGHKRQLPWAEQQQRRASSP